MPEPLGDESREQFFDRCMMDPEAIGSFPDASTRGGFCSATWDRRTESNAIKTQAALALSGLRQLSAPHLEHFLAPAREALEAVGVQRYQGVVLPTPPKVIATQEAEHDDLVISPASDPNDLLGAHAHGLAPGGTEVGGEHSHAFALTDGTVVVTDVSGEHSHEGQSEPGTPHQHEITLPSGDKLMTEPWQDPGHQFLVDVTTWDSPHGHDLNIPGGETLVSLGALDLRDTSIPGSEGSDVQEAVTQGQERVRCVRCVQKKARMSR